MFYLVHDGIVLLLTGAKACYHPSLYLDAHGEEDRGLRRGKPLHLSGYRQAALWQLWLRHALPVEVARARASAATRIRLSYY